MMGRHGRAWLPGTLCHTTHSHLSYLPQPGSSKGLEGTASLWKAGLEGVTSLPQPH